MSTLKAMDLETLSAELVGKGPQDTVKWALDKFGGQIALACSLGAEDMVLVDMLAKLDVKARIFVLDTGRLHQETYDVMDEARQKYNIEFEVLFPDAADVEQMLKSKGPNSFFDSIENRKECCNIRKVKQLNRTLGTLDAWITGLRREQSVTRESMFVLEKDEAHNDMFKLNPLADWTEEMVWDYIKEHKVPHNALHRKGYPSIGCAPCTRAIQPGEDVRAGRWWWESADTKECGLHVKKD